MRLFLEKKIDWARLPILPYPKIKDSHLVWNPRISIFNLHLWKNRLYTKAVLNLRVRQDRQSRPVNLLLQKQSHHLLYSIIVMLFLAWKFLVSLEYFYVLHVYLSVNYFKGNTLHLFSWIKFKLEEAITMQIEASPWHPFLSSRLIGRSLIHKNTATKS